MCSWYYQIKLSRPLVTFIRNILYCSASGFMVTMLAYLVFHPIVLSFSYQGHQIPTLKTYRDLSHLNYVCCKKTSCVKIRYAALEINYQNVWWVVDTSCLENGDIEYGWNGNWSCTPSMVDMNVSCKDLQGKAGRDNYDFHARGRTIFNDLNVRSRR